VELQETFLRREPPTLGERLMKSTKRTLRKATSAGQKVVRTTVGELIAAMVETVGVERAQALLSSRSPLRQVLRQRLVVAPQ
jgi:hypothetical protein